MDWGGRSVRAVWVAGLVSLLLVVGAVPARAAFPGRDGDLVVATGNGLELVAPATAAASPICTEVALCGHPAQPAFSPNGRAVAFVDTTSGRPVVIAADGSCLWCLIGAPLTRRPGSEPAFTPGGQGVTVVGNGLWSVSLTGGRARRLLKGRVDSAVWSSRGLFAVVRGGWIWVGRPGHGKLRRLARGDSPSFSPDGARLAFARDGYVRIVAVRGRLQRRLVKGDSPAWSPNGRQIAYIGSGAAVEIVAVRGGRPHAVGTVHGSALDWQPLPVSGSRFCTLPRGSKLLASSSGAVVYSRGTNRLFGPEVFGCLRSLERTQLLSSGSRYFTAFIAVRLAGRFAAVETTVESQYAVTEDATMYDLSSGAATPLGEAGTGSGGGPIGGLDSLALDSSGFAAWRETTQVSFPEPISALSCPSPSLCLAGDAAGDILSTTNPASGKSAWSMTSVSGSFGPEVTDLSCPSVSLCLGLGSAYRLLSSTDPTGGAGAWAQDDIDPQNFLGALSCPSVSLCVATDVGDVLTSTDPTGGPAAWVKTPIGQGVVGYDISCPSVTLCVATVSGPGSILGTILTSTDPTGGATAWRETRIDHGVAVSCPSVTLCVMSGGGGSVLTSTDPTGGAGAWTATPIDQGNNVTAISCPSVSLCVAVDDQGNILSSTDPAGGVGAWSKASVDRGRLLNVVSCPSVSLCVAGDQDGNALTSTDPTGDANAWTITPADVPPCASQPSQCVSDQLYARDDQGTRTVDSAALGDGNLIGNVTLDGDSLALSWTHDGAQRQLQLR